MEKSIYGIISQPHAPRTLVNKEFLTSAKMKTHFKLLCICLIVLVLHIRQFESARGGRRRGGKLRNKASPRLIYMNPKAKQYYDNEDGAQITKASHFDYEFEIGHKIIFICVAKGDPIPHFTWFKDTVEIYSHPYLQISEWRLSETKVKSKLEIDPARQMDSGNYECQANNKYAVDRRLFKADF